MGGPTIQITGICAKAQHWHTAQLQNILIAVLTPRISISNTLAARILLSHQHHYTPKREPTMKHLSTLFALTFLASASFSQETNVPKRITLKLMVKDSIHRVDYGYLAGMTDSTIVMVKAPVIFDHAITGNNANSIAYQNLSEVSIARKGSVGRGILFGA